MLSRLGAWPWRGRGQGDIIRPELTEVSYNTWIAPINFIKLEGNMIYLDVISPFIKNIIETRYVNLIKAAMFNVTLQKYDVKIQAGDLHKA